MAVELKAGDFVVEAGIRQAWPFLTFAKAGGSEVRLYLDSDVQVLPWMTDSARQDSDEILPAFL